MSTQPSDVQRVRVVDFDMSIGSLIGLMIKIAIASIPAMIILWGIAMILGVLAMTVLGIGSGLAGG